MRHEIQTKLAAARTRLMLERPFIGVLLMHLPFGEASARRCPTIATDARALYFNPDYIAGLTLGETQFVLAHEALHCALVHFARRGHRIRKRWDVACDHAVNLILLQEGMKPPPGALVNSEFLGLTAEEIYPLIPPDTSELLLDGHLFGGPADAQDNSWDGAVDVSRRGEPRERESWSSLMDADSGAPETLAQRWQNRVASAAQAAMHAGHLSASLARCLEHVIQPRMPWRALLARFVMSVARDDYSFRRSSRRDGDALLPRLASDEIRLVVALDTSGSIGDEEMCEFTSEVEALKGQVRARLVLLACSEELAPEGPWHFAPWDPVTLPRALRGGGGTRFTPVFEWVAREQVRPDLLLYFTDARGEFPDASPPYPVVWLVKGRAGVPWGERIQLN